MNYLSFPLMETSTITYEKTIARDFTIFVRFIQIWSDLVRFGQIWSDLSRRGKIRWWKCLSRRFSSGITECHHQSGESSNCHQTVVKLSSFFIILRPDVTIRRGWRHDDKKRCRVIMMIMMMIVTEWITWCCQGFPLYCRGMSWRHTKHADVRVWCVVFPLWRHSKIIRNGFFSFYFSRFSLILQYLDYAHFPSFALGYMEKIFNDGSIAMKCHILNVLGGLGGHANDGRCA